MFKFLPSNCEILLYVVCYVMLHVLAVQMRLKIGYSATMVVKVFVGCGQYTIGLSDI